MWPIVAALDTVITDQAGDVNAGEDITNISESANDRRQKKDICPSTSSSD